MFTGLIKTTGSVRRVDQRGDCMITIAMADAFDAEIGDSIACHGVCLTAVKINGNEFKVSLSAETMAKSTAADWQVGTLLNLEPALRMGDPLGGHLVSGHVDGIGRTVGSQPSGDSTIWSFEAPADLARFIAPKGSITIDGVSLTVNEAHGARFTVNIIPHTAKVTSFGHLQAGDRVNLEVDQIARYVDRLLMDRQ
jgi:riboflavin synthase